MNTAGGVHDQIDCIDRLPGGTQTIILDPPNGLPVDSMFPSRYAQDFLGVSCTKLHHSDTINIQSTVESVSRQGTTILDSQPVESLRRWHWQWILSSTCVICPLIRGPSQPHRCVLQSFHSFDSVKYPIIIISFSVTVMFMCLGGSLSRCSIPYFQ